MSGRDVYLEWDGGSVHLRGGRPGEYGLFVSGDGIDGWDSAPEAKVEMSERQSADGAHAIDERMVLYAARTVVVSFHAHGRDRSDVRALLRSVSAACHRLVRLRVVDADEDTYVTGYVRPVIEPEWRDRWATGEIEVVCADPRRYSTNQLSVTLMPLAASSGGLFFGDELKGLVFDLDYGSVASDARNVAVLENDGTSTSYPVITAYGQMPSGLTLYAGDLVLAYSQPIGNVPLVLDCLECTATVGGTDVSRSLTSRGFPSVPPGGSVAVSLQSPGTGFVSVTWHHTYI